MLTKEIYDKDLQVILCCVIVKWVSTAEGNFPPEILLMFFVLLIFLFLFLL